MKPSIDIPKIVFTDIDGVWTDGGMYYSDNGVELKKFNTRDSAGIIFLNYFRIPTVIITGENNSIVTTRARKLGIQDVALGIKNKLEYARKICIKYKINFCDAAYIGDDIIDIPLLMNVGYSAAPRDSPKYVRDVCKVVVPVIGGQGAFRWFVEEYILGKCRVKEAVKALLSGKHLKNE